MTEVRLPVCFCGALLLDDVDLSTPTIFNRHLSQLHGQEEIDTVLQIEDNMINLLTGVNLSFDILDTEGCYAFEDGHNSLSICTQTPDGYVLWLVSFGSVDERSQFVSSIVDILSTSQEIISEECAFDEANDSERTLVGLEQQNVLDCEQQEYLQSQNVSLSSSISDITDEQRHFLMDGRDSNLVEQCFHPVPYLVFQPPNQCTTMPTTAKDRCIDTFNETDTASFIKISDKIEPKYEVEEKRKLRDGQQSEKTDDGETASDHRLPTNADLIERSIDIYQDNLPPCSVTVRTTPRKGQILFGNVYDIHPISGLQSSHMKMKDLREDLPDTKIKGLIAKFEEQCNK